MVLETLQHLKLYAKASKCQFDCSSVGFLGHVISAHCVAVDPCKVSAVVEWATPTCCTASLALLITTVTSCNASPAWLSC